jgi:hypothetical protein
VRLARISRQKLLAAARAARGQAVVGDVRLWPALDRAKGTADLKKFTLRAVGQHIEVWVASDDDGIAKNLEFPAGDCRNDDRVQLTDAQAQYLAGQFDTVMYSAATARRRTPPPSRRRPRSRRTTTRAPETASSRSSTTFATPSSTTSASGSASGASSRPASTTSSTAT